MKKTMHKRVDVMQVAISDLMAILSQNAHMKEQIQRLQAAGTKEVERRRRMAQKKRKGEAKVFVCTCCEEDTDNRSRHTCESCLGWICDDCWDGKRSLCAECSGMIDDSDDDLDDDAWDDGGDIDDDDDDDSGDLDDDAWDSDIEPDDPKDW